MGCKPRTRVHLKAESSDAVLPRKCGLFLPVGHDLLSPLPFQDVLVVGGQAQVTQFGVVSAGEPPGQPEKSVIRLTPMRDAKRTVCSKTR